MAIKELLCAGCGVTITYDHYPNDARLSAMQAHDRECLSHDFDGVPCRHGGNCYEWRTAGKGMSE